MVMFLFCLHENNSIFSPFEMKWRVPSWIIYLMILFKRSKNDTLLQYKAQVISFILIYQIIAKIATHQSCYKASRTFRQSKRSKLLSQKYADNSPKLLMKSSTLFITFLLCSIFYFFYLFLLHSIPYFICNLTDQNLFRNLKMSEVDELYELRNNFYLGHFATAVNEANKLKLCKIVFIFLWLTSNLAGDKAVERDVYLFRSLIAQKQYSTVLSEVKSSSPPQLVAVKCFAEYLARGNAESQLKILGRAIFNLFCS